MSLVLEKDTRARCTRAGVIMACVVWYIARPPPPPPPPPPRHVTGRSGSGLALGLGRESYKGGPCAWELCVRGNFRRSDHMGLFGVA